MIAVSRQAAIALVLIVVLSMTSACKQEDIKLVSSNLNKATKAVAVIQDTIEAANKTVPPLLSDAAGVKAMGVSLKFSQSLAKAIEMTRHIESLDAPTKASLLGVLQPLLADLTAAINDPALINIKDQKTKDAILGSLIIVQTSLAAIQTAIAVH